MPSRTPMTRRFWVMRQMNGCSTPALRSSAAKQWIERTGSYDNDDYGQKHHSLMGGKPASRGSIRPTWAFNVARIRIFFTQVKAQHLVKTKLHDPGKQTCRQYVKRSLSRSLDDKRRILKINSIFAARQRYCRIHAAPDLNTFPIRDLTDLKDCFDTNILCF